MFFFGVLGGLEQLDCANVTKFVSADASFATGSKLTLSTLADGCLECCCL